MTPRPIEPPRSAFEPALALARDGGFAAAVRAVRDSLGREPEETRLADAARTLAQVARIAEEAGDVNEALAALDQALELRRGWADLHLRRALLCESQGRRSEARESLDAALHINPRFVAARVERALLDARDGLIGESLEALQAIAADTRVPDARTFQQGLECLERADWDEAGTLVRRALRLDEPELDECLRRFQAFLDQDQPAEAAQVVRDALARHEAYPDLHLMLGTAELREGHHDDALVSLGRALELNPDYSAARLLFARTLEATGARAQALEQVALVLQREPDHPQALALDAEWNARHGRVRARAKGA